MRKWRETPRDANTPPMETPGEYLDGGEWLNKLRQRFMEVASRRVDDSDVEDVVQEALRIVVEKRGDSGVSLPWCFQVLRNAIGNYYRREGTRRRRLSAQSDDDAGTATPSRFAEELDSRETLVLIEDALDEMRDSDPQCGRYITRLVADAKPHDVAAEEGLEPAVFYRRLYRCRQKLRALLRTRGVDA